ncbi:DUF1889 family protein [Photorhabdus temperata]|uniref:Uncharacterized protein n=2 Tax=Photorhabdus temperata TaxID=574560 RepID=A0A081RSR1_PHOTE|nr:DUF1889 family protein [Photorhabdus temperata]ERT10887.1 hypothetical protein O185_22390 [Photorhabdus temperata J3]KER01714.1 protein of unknown function (DUF1889) [Photorhabdus temperata subsp. temperata Meg1]MCT8348795.1 DUF1889 family protein [Photorhabdus temperata]
MKPIFKRTLENFNSLNTSVSSPHPSDESYIKEILKFLKNEGNELTSNDIFTWGSSHNWDNQFTKKVSDWADKINSGGRVIIKHPRLGEKFKQELRSLK